MSRLRDQLQQARSAYASARYPGRLATDVLHPARGVWPRRLLGIAATAAAVLLVVLWPRERSQPPAPVAVADSPAVSVEEFDIDDAGGEVLLNSFAQVPTMPEFGQLIPLSAGDATALVPSFPALEELISTDTTALEDSR